MDRDDLFADALIRWEEAKARGELVTVAALCPTWPAKWQDEFRKLVAKVDAMFGETAAAADADLAPPRDAGRYKPMEVHAAGGLGVVWTAEDTEVGRAVALKFMKGWTAADRDARRRFLLEAEITGKLEHPGIVPVYGVGQDPDGRPYYAMRFVRGGARAGNTLRDAIDHFHAADAPDEAERAVEFARLLRSFVAVCETVAYAHSRGVVHRDIKPANVLIGPYGETLLVDWGLAKRTGEPEPPEPARPQPQPTAAGLTPTQPGVAKGTPAFMSPEQARGEVEAVGPASDVFALGATLYAILTGRPPYQGPMAIEDARTGRFPAPRQAKPSAPRALEAVCLKAMALQPGDRYPDPKALAADVERWLADEPVSAWREPLGVRARRWVKRHRQLVSASAVGLVVAAGLSAALAVQAYRQREYEREQKKQEQALRAKAEENFDYARGAVREMVRQAIGNPLLRRPGMIRARQALLQSALHYYRAFIAAQRPDDPSVQEELAFAHYAVAVIADETGDYGQARAEYAEAYRVYGALADRDPGNAETPSLLAAAGLGLGRCECHLLDWRSGLPHLDESIARLGRLAADRPGDPERRAALVVARLAAAEHFEGAGDRRRAAELRTDAGGDLDTLGAGPGVSDDVRLAAALRLNDFAVLDLDAGRYPAAAARLDRAARLADAIAAARRDDSVARALPWIVAVNRAVVLARTGQTVEANRLFDEAQARLRSLADLDPDVTSLAVFAAEAFLKDGRSALAARDFARAEGKLQQARAALRDLRRRYPSDWDVRKALGFADQNLGVVLRERGQPQQAAEALAEARQLLAELRAATPGAPQYRLHLAEVDVAEGMLRQKARDFAAAARHFDAARVALEGLLAEDPTNPEYRHALGVACTNLGAALQGLDRPREVVAHRERARGLLEAVAAECPAVVEYRHSRDQARYGLALAYGVLAGDEWRHGVERSPISATTGAAAWVAARPMGPTAPGGAFDLYGKAHALFALLLRERPEMPGLRDSYLNILMSWATGLRADAAGLLSADQFADALPLFERAADLWDELAAARPADPTVREMLGLARLGLAMTCEGRARALTPADPADAAEARRVIRRGLAALDGVPAASRAAPGVPVVRADLQRQLARFPAGGR